MGGISLASWFATKAKAASVGNAIKDRSVVVLNLQGGPTQFETFDPKMTAPAEIRSITGEVKTKIPGVTFGGSLPKLAVLADKMAIVRSYRHGISSHGPAAMHVMAGGNPTGAMMGALYASVAGLADPDTGIPQNVLVTPSVVGSQYKKLYHNVGRVSQTGSLSSVFKPFDSSAGGEVLDNMKLTLKGNRLDDRRSLLFQLDRLKRQFDVNSVVESANRFQQQAFDVLTRGVSAAFDLSEEDPQTISRYDTSAFEPTNAVKSRNSYATQFSPVALGKQMLLARRLCEGGCGFVTVTCGGWDMHGGGKEFTMTDGLNSLTPAVDKAVSAFIEDVEERGLSDKILLVITGEFGRTPRINKNGGRDHWGNLCTLAFIGGGLKMGQVVGRSDKTASVPASEPISSNQVLATIMHTLFDTGEVRILPSVSQELKRIITDTQPIRELV
ncbi:MAG: DUF1501 domain-containing protein [Planctomycetes bacterium]|nr:DUF1501 domain-containing protein [Planctomycetota bacterium]MCH9726787.1 DUF1501 domain-containing protein [Planctomycetota bacterium]